MQPENIRLEKFRKLKKEVRGSTIFLLIGIDVAKEKHVAFFGTATGKTLVKGLVFDNNRLGFAKLLTKAEAVKAKNKLVTVIFGLEPTATYHKPLGQ